MFEAKEMRVPVPSSRQVKEGAPPENRVVGLSRSSVACAGSFGSEPVELRQEIGSGYGSTRLRVGPQEHAIRVGPRIARNAK